MWESCSPNVVCGTQDPPVGSRAKPQYGVPQKLKKFEDNVIKFLLLKQSKIENFPKSDPSFSVRVSECVGFNVPLDT